MCITQFCASYDSQPPQDFVSKCTDFLKSNAPPGFHVSLVWRAEEVPEPSTSGENITGWPPRKRPCRTPSECIVDMSVRSCSIITDFFFFAASHPLTTLSGYESRSPPQLHGESSCIHCLCAPCIIAEPPSFLQGASLHTCGTSSIASVFIVPFGSCSRTWDYGTMPSISSERGEKLWWMTLGRGFHPV